MAKLLTYESAKIIVQETNMPLSRLVEYDFQHHSEDFKNYISTLKKKAAKFRLTPKSNGLQKLLRHFR